MKMHTPPRQIPVSIKSPIPLGEYLIHTHLYVVKTPQSDHGALLRSPMAASGTLC
jgi:hypothetical protein